MKKIKKLTPRITAWDRDEEDPCEAGTPGCSVDHTAERNRDGDKQERGCDTW